MIKSLIVFILAFAIAASLDDENTKKPKLKLYKTRTQNYVTRLHPGQDIMETLTGLLSNRQHRAISIVAATGSVLHCYIRFANISSLNRVNGPLQVTSLTGTFDRNLRPHVHIAVADGRGIATGGHLPSLTERASNITEKRDCPIHTTLELSLIVYKDVVFQRKIDPETTYDELTIRLYSEPLWKKFIPIHSDQDIEFQQ